MLQLAGRRTWICSLTGHIFFASSAGLTIQIMEVIKSNPLGAPGSRFQQPVFSFVLDMSSVSEIDSTSIASESGVRLAAPSDRLSPVKKRTWLPVLPPSPSLPVRRPPVRRPHLFLHDKQPSGRSSTTFSQ